MIQATIEGPPRNTARNFPGRGESFSGRRRDSVIMDSDPSDAVLLQAVADRDLVAFRQLFERHAGWVSVRLARRCNDRDLVADAVHDTFVAIWRKPEGFRGDGDIAAWIWGIASRRLVSRMRTASRPLPTTGAVAPAPAAEDQALASVEHGDVGQALNRLSPEMQAVVQAVVLDGLTAREAALRLNLHVDNVKTRLHRAKAQLRAALAGGSS